jgi:hypothetical protein
MSLRVFDTPDFKRLAIALRSIKNQVQLDSIQQNLSSRLHGIRIIASFPTSEPYLKSPFNFPSKFSMKYFTPYLCNPNLYYFHHSPLILPHDRNLDYTVTFDTNFASYIKTVVKNNTIHMLSGEIQQTFDYVLANGFNFDPLFYFVENIKLARPIAMRMKNQGSFTPIEFWDSLNEYFRSNMVYLQLFLNIDDLSYRNTRNLKFKISLKEAEAKAIDFAYKFYASPENNFLANDYFLPNQRLGLLYLLAILQIQFSSNKSAKNKLSEFLKFIQERGIVYLERETIVAFEYFKNRSNIPILTSIYKGCNPDGLLGKVDNIAWDFTACRFLEQLFAVHPTGDYYIPFLLSFDKNLRELIKIYPVKAVVVDSDSGYVHSIPDINTNDYFMNNGCWDIWSEFATEEKRAERNSRIVNDDKETLSKIKAEYQQLRNVLFK